MIPVSIWLKNQRKREEKSLPHSDRLDTETNRILDILQVTIVTCHVIQTIESEGLKGIEESRVSVKKAVIILGDAPSQVDLNLFDDSGDFDWKEARVTVSLLQFDAQFIRSALKDQSQVKVVVYQNPHHYLIPVVLSLSLDGYTTDYSLETKINSDNPELSTVEATVLEGSIEFSSDSLGMGSTEGDTDTNQRSDPREIVIPGFPIVNGVLESVEPGYQYYKGLL